jgi:hypothetical protein
MWLIRHSKIYVAAPGWGKLLIKWGAVLRHSKRKDILYKKNLNQAKIIKEKRESY